MFACLCLLGFNNLATSRAPTCDSAQSLRFYSVATLGDQATGTITQYPTQSQYPNTELIHFFQLLLNFVSFFYIVRQFCLTVIIKFLCEYVVYVNDVMDT